MNCLRVEKDRRIGDNTIPDVRNLYRLTKENEAIKDRISDILEISF